MSPGPRLASVSVEAETEDTVRSVGTEAEELEDRVELRAGVTLLELDIVTVVVFSILTPQLNIYLYLYITKHVNNILVGICVSVS